jgi:flavin-dependent dehydrogenase
MNSTSGSADLTRDGDCFDVCIIGGALSGSATALQLLRRRPGLRICIVEKSSVFSRRVGESTVEISSYFLDRILGLTQHLNEKHLVKQGLRFHFSNEKVSSIADCSELGPKYHVRLPGYQVDRAILDEELLSRVVAAGVVVRRPARVSGYTLSPGGQQTVEIDAGGRQETIRCRWLVDATGVRSLVGRTEGWIVPNTEHPIASVWSRWTGVTNWNDPQLARSYPQWAGRCFGTRFTATNHLIGRGWWSWWIPLSDGDVSIGVVFDQRLIDLPDGPTLAEKFRSFLERHAGARELLKDASCRKGDVHYRRNLSYSARIIANDGVVLVGDAAGFIDPFYSPGMDWVAYTTAAAAQLIADEGSGPGTAEAVNAHNQVFRQSYRRWFEAIYKDKYYYLGDYELMSVAFRLDLGLYYLGIVSQPYLRGPDTLTCPAFGNRHSRWPYRLIRHYNRRLASIARTRMEMGRWGRRNQGRYFPFSSYELRPSLGFRVLWALVIYLSLELCEGWRSWGCTRPVEPPASASKRRSP